MSSMPSYCLDRDAVLKDGAEKMCWRHNIPDYSKVTELFEKYKTTDHQPGSLEFVVQNLVKNWEKEASHKVNPREWFTIDMDNYKFSCNGQEKFTADQVIEQGTYNVLIGQTNYYDSRQISFEESHAVFKKSFSQGFAWEVLEVYSPPPTVTFKWRHFGLMMNEFSCRGLSGHVYRVDPTKKMVEIFGMCKATVNDRLQIQDLQIFYDPNQLFTQLTEISPFAPFESFANPTAKMKSNSLAPMPSPSSNTNLVAASSAKLRSESNLKKTMDEQELKSISFNRNPSSKFCVLS